MHGGRQAGAGDIRPRAQDKLVAAYKHASERGYLSAKKCIYDLLGLESDPSVPRIDTATKKHIICLDAGHGGEIWAQYPHGSPTPQYKRKT